MSSLDLGTWTPEEISAAWIYWLEFVPPEKRGLFACGGAMFLCDIDLADDAVSWLEQVYLNSADAILKKWRYLYAQRPDFRTRYKPLFDYLAAQGAL
jgi:hypothetical protein